jgi:RNA polymerase sigma-70 factor (ECF subfamily)
VCSYSEWVPIVKTPETWTDEELVETICRGPKREAERCREILFRRFYPKVLSWCRRFSGDQQEASDLAQDVFLRIHERLHTFKGRSRFSTWLYTVTRRTAINRGIAARRREAISLEGEELPEPVDPAPNAQERAEVGQLARELRLAMARDLEPLEARVLYLHHVNGMTLPAITDLLGLENKSGAKAYIVNGRRKLDRKFGRWMRRQTRMTAM